MNARKVFLTAALFLLVLGFGFAKNEEKKMPSNITISGTANDDVNYDESKVPHYVLPDVLTCNDGSKVTSVKMWEQKRRQEVLDCLCAQEYGYTPTAKISVFYKTLSKNKKALNGKATCEQVRFRFTNGKKDLDAILLMYIPNKRKGKVPVFVGYNFKGNHSTIADPSVLYSPSMKFVDMDSTRGNQSSRWCFEKIIDRGYAVVTMCYHDIYPDRPGLIDKSIAALFPDYDPNSTAMDQWKAIGAWAWGSSRIVDFLETQNWVDKEKIAIMGHSRQGKAALWAGAQDTRFKVVISNDSGCGGAALFKRVFGENVAKIITIEPQWFCPRFRLYANREAEMPFDQHWLLSLIAPRHLYVASAEDDLWADPKGEYLSLYNASPVFKLYGMQGLSSPEPPTVNSPIMLDVGYHKRTGKHDVTDYDWERFMDFCDRCFGL